jgi:hypothetical protein
LPRAIAARAMTLSRLIAASATTIAVAAAHRSRRAAPGSRVGAASRCESAETLRAMTISAQAPISLTSGTPSSDVAMVASSRRRTIAPPEPIIAARRASSRMRPLQATAISSALSAPSSRSTTKIWKG